MYGVCAIVMPLALALVLMASLLAMAGMFEACRAAQPEVGNVARYVQIARKAAQVELASAESTCRTVLRARIAVNKSMDRGAAMASNRTVRAHQLYRQAECDLFRRLVRNTPDADLAEAVYEADLLYECIGVLRDVAQPTAPAVVPAASD